MHLTNFQLDVLRQCNEKYDDDWQIEFNNGSLELVIHPFAMHINFERIIDVEGKITRYDQNTDTVVEATLDPLKDSIPSTKSPGKVLRYNY